MAISLLKCTSEVNYFLFCILVPWCKCHVSIHIFSYVQFWFKTLFFHVAMLLCNVGHVWCICKAIQLACNTFLVLLVHKWMISEEENWDHFNQFLLSFSFLNPKVNNSDNNHKCLLRNQNDILNNPIPCKLTLSMYSLWNIKCRYDPKYASQYKYKDTNYVKVSTGVSTLVL